MQLDNLPKADVRRQMKVRYKKLNQILFGFIFNSLIFFGSVYVLGEQSRALGIVKNQNLFELYSSHFSHSKWTVLIGAICGVFMIVTGVLMYIHGYLKWTCPHCTTRLPHGRDVGIIKAVTKWKTYSGYPESCEKCGAILNGHLS